MKKIFIGALISCLATFAVADGLDSAYVGMGVGMSNLTDPTAHTGTSQPGFKAFVGYDVADWMQMEASFYSVGFNKFGKNYTVDMGSTAGDYNAIVSSYAQVNNFTVAGKFDWWWVDSFAIYAILGLAMQYNQYNTSAYPKSGSVVGRTTQAIGSNSGFQPGLVGGIGAQYNFGRVGLRLEDVYQVSSNNSQTPANGLGSFNTYGFSLQYHF